MGFGDPGTALGFAEEQLAVALHLGAELDDVATPYPGIEQQIEGQPRLCANRMARLVARRLVLGPGADAIGIGAAQSAHVACRVLCGIAFSGELAHVNSCRNTLTRLLAASGKAAFSSRSFATCRGSIVANGKLP